MRELFRCTDKDGVVTTYYTDEANRVIWTDSSYPRNYQSLHEQLEDENSRLPKTKRKYLDDSGKIVSYLTAKKRGIVV